MRSNLNIDISFNNFCATLGGVRRTSSPNPQEVMEPHTIGIVTRDLPPCVPAGTVSGILKFQPQRSCHCASFAENCECLIITRQRWVLEYVHLNMDATIKELLASLQDIRDKADAALRRTQMASEQRSLAWRCTACGHIKHFTRPALAEVALPCPKCQGSKFEPA